MTRVKYPSKKEIHSQVKEIIERSEIFDEIAGNEYTECQRVSSRNGTWKNVACVMAGVAVLAVLMIIVEPLLGGNGTRKSHAYGPSLSATGEAKIGESSNDNNKGKDVTNDNILDIVDSYSDSYTEVGSGLDKIDSVSIFTKVRGTYKNDKVSVERTYQIPIVSKEGGTFAEITKAYDAYTDRIESYLQNKYYADGSKYNDYKNVNVKADFTVSHNSNSYNGVTNILSFSNKYEEMTSGNGQNIEKIEEVYYNNFDVETGQRISLSDVYTSDKLYTEIAKVIRQEISEMVQQNIFSWNYISDNYISEERIAKIIKEEDNWCISSTGSLIIQCNNFRTAVYAEDNLEYSRAESFIIDKSVLIPLDKNSKYITYQ